MKINRARLSSARGVLRVAVLVSCVFGLTVLASAQKVTKVAISPASVVGGSSATGTVTISPKAGTDGVAVMLISSSEAATVIEDISVAKGKTTATFSIGTVPVATNTTATITASVGQSSASATLTIKAPTMTSFAL